jgi:S-adenosylmethionine hydrolase
VPGTVTLTTDFGTRDPYVGALKGVLLTTTPGLQLVDLTHDISAQDILAGAYVLRNAAFEFPPKTVHLAVIDPAVGSTRRPLVVDAGGYRWVGPDNGLFSFALACPAARAFQITHPELRREPLSNTFHGRDLFAPTAARLAAGFPLEQVGPVVTDALCLATTQVVVAESRIDGAVIHVDHFGNAISCISQEDIATLGEAAELRVTAGDVSVEGIARTYADVESGSPAALIGSGGLLEFCVRDGSAAACLGLQRGDTLCVERSR